MTQSRFKHNFPFNPDYGFDLAGLLKIPGSDIPADFEDFWQKKYRQALNTPSAFALQDSGEVVNSWRIFDCSYNSTENIRIGGWLLLPENQMVTKAIVVGHGYGGAEGPDTSWNLQGTALLFPCLRGFGRSALAPISSEPKWHVLHDIQDKNKYILAGCVQDFWCAASALLTLFPQVRNKIGLIGSSFSGGLGVFASGFDPRISRSFFHLPTFGNLNVRMNLPTRGSTAALQEFARSEPGLSSQTLPYFDASSAAPFLTQPTYWALALFDPYVAPPGQFSIYNACHSPSQLYLQDAGHFTYPDGGKQHRELRRNLEVFFANLGKEDAA